jgi:iron complex transport system substrate-binding protein
MPGAFPRQIRHAGGSTDIARAPQRVVGLDARAVEVAVALGVVPVGVASGIAGDPMLQQALAGVPTVGAGAEPDYEAIIALTPDLILGHDALDYGKLSAIAPTVFRTGTTATWRETFALFAQALGRETRTEEIVQAYEGRIRKLNAALPNPRPSISLIRVRSSDVWYYQRANYTASILTDLGFPRPPAQNVDDIAARNMSLETLQQYAPADLILVAADANAGGFTKDLLDGALWQSLDAVKKGNFLVVDAAWWINGRTYLAANSILDDIAEHFGVSG